MMKNKSVRILGIDPGTLCTGYGVIEVNGNHIKAVDYGYIKNSNQSMMPERFARIYEGLKKVIEKNKPDCMSIEKLFYCKNVQSAFRLGEARGVAILVGAQHHLKIYEYEPRKIKLAAVGYGAAHKSQVQAMMQTILGIKKLPKASDVADALAIALCHANNLKFGKIEDRRQKIRCK